MRNWKGGGGIVCVSTLDQGRCVCTTTSYDYCFALYRAAAAASSSSSLPFLLSKCSIRFGLICLLCRLIVTVADGTIEKRIDKNSSFSKITPRTHAFHHDSRSLTCGLVAVGVGVSFYDTVRQSRGAPLLTPVIIVQPNLLVFFPPFLALQPRIPRTKK
jgi:hypothetical protein